MCQQAQNYTAVGKGTLKTGSPQHGMRQWKIITEGHSRKWSRDVMFLDREQCRLANGTQRP
jgi:hypothetical protein